MKYRLKIVYGIIPCVLACFLLVQRYTGCEVQCSGRSDFNLIESSSSDEEKIAFMKINSNEVKYEVVFYDVSGNAISDPLNYLDAEKLKIFFTDKQESFIHKVINKENISILLGE